MKINVEAANTINFFIDYSDVVNSRGRDKLSQVQQVDHGSHFRHAPLVFAKKMNNGIVKVGMKY